MTTEIGQGKKVQQIIKKAREEIEKKTGKTPEELFLERENRISDAIQLKEPDRVPVCLRGGYLILSNAGLPLSTVFYDPVAYKQAIIKAIIDFEPDAIRSIASDDISGLALEKLGDRQYLWPGGPIREDQRQLWNEMEIMKENEYDLFISDPGDFILRYYLPRRFGALSPLAKLPALHSFVGSTAFPRQSSQFNSPEITKAFESIFQAGAEQAKFDEVHKEISDNFGVPLLIYPGGFAGPPFDTLATHLRGMRGIMVDMFKRPEKLLAALERVLEWQLTSATTVNPDEKKKRVASGGNHFQSEEFISKKQFETFPWPTWKKAMLASINLGYIPVPFMEGKNDDRIECFLELPKASVLMTFEKIDMARAKAILGGHLCISGDVPASLLWSGSPQEVEDYCKNLIKVCGKGGGFILSSSCSLDDAKPENVKAMVDAAKKYGRYH